MEKKEKKIGRIIYRWLTVLVLGAFVLAAAAGLLLQNYFQERQSFTLLHEYIDNFEANFDFNAYVKAYLTTDWPMENDEESRAEGFPSYRCGLVPLLLHPEDPPVPEMLSHPQPEPRPVCSDPAPENLSHTSYKNTYKVPS